MPMILAALLDHERRHPLSPATPAGQTLLSAFDALTALVLFLTSGAKLLTVARGGTLLTLTDPILGMQYSQVMLLAAALEFCGFLCLMLGRSCLKYFGFIWLTGMFALYRLGINFLPSQPRCPCLGSLADWSHLDPATLDTLLGSFLAVGLIGSILAIHMHCPKQAGTSRPPDNTLVPSC